MSRAFDVANLLPPSPRADDLREIDDRAHFRGRAIHEASVTATHWVSANPAGGLVLRARDERGVELGLVFLGLRADAFELGLEGEIAASRRRLERRRSDGFAASDEPFARLRVEGCWRRNTVIEASGRRNGRWEMVVARWARAPAAGMAPAACGWLPRPACGPVRAPGPQRDDPR